MEQVNWETLLGGTVGGIIIGGAMGALMVYAKFRSIMTQAYSGDNEAASKKRTDDAEFEAKENARIIDYWKALNTEITDQYRQAMIAVQGKIKQLEEDGEKRNLEHVKCQIESAELRVEIKHLKERLTVLEKGGRE